MLLPLPRSTGSSTLCPALRSVALALALAASACGGGRGGSDPAGGGGPGTLIAIDVQPVTTTTFPAGETRSFKATGHYSSGPNQDLTATARWTVVDPTIATTVAAGVVKGLKGGATQLRATAGGIGSNDLGITVGAPVVAAVTVSPAGATIAYHSRLQYGATAIYSDGSHRDATADATWAATPASVATVTAVGLVHGAAAGAATISATVDGVTGSVPATVTGPSTALHSLTVTPASPTVPVGVPSAFTATGVFDLGGTLVSQDLTADVTWSSAPAGVATISAAGVATPVAPGAATITATLAAYGAGASTTLHVTAASPVSLAVTPSSATVGVGTGVPLAAVATFSDGSTRDVTAAASWVSSSLAVAEVSAGVATGVAPGAAAITATWATFSGSATVTVAGKTLTSLAVTPSGATVPAGVDQPLTATGTFSDLSTQDLTGLASWTSSATTTAAVSNLAGREGVVTAVAPGLATITATYGGVSGSAPLDVAAATLTSIDVTPATTVLRAGESVQYRATGHYAGGATRDLTGDVVWTSSDGTVASISNASGSPGLATGVAASGVPVAIVAQLGSVASTSGGVPPASLRVDPPVLVRIDLAPASVLLSNGSIQDFTATGVYGDGSSQDLTASATWDTLDPSVAATSATPGRFAAVGLGVTRVLATLGTVSGAADVAVTSAVPVELTLSPAAPTVAAGTKQQLDAIVVFSDGSKVDVTASATWSVLPAGLATITASGLATGNGPGSATVSAQALGLTGSTPLTVTAATLQLLDLSPTDPVVPLGVPQAFGATGIFTDGTREDLTAQVSWTSSDTGVATVSATGLATPTGVGGTTITATRGAVAASTTLTVTKETLVAATLAIDPAGTTLAAGTTFPFTVSGTYTDGSTLDLTELATWSSSAPPIAAVSNAPGSKGLVDGIARGTADIGAAYGGEADLSPLTVTTAVLVSVAVSPSAATVPAGMTQPLVAVGTFSDGNTQDLTAEAGWTSSATTTAAVSNAPGSEGLVTGIAPGAVRITATFAGLSGHADLVVTSATISSIDVTPATATLPVKYSRPYQALATYSDGSTRDVTTQVTWVSSGTAVASVSNAAGSQGLATGVATGTTSITATLGGATSAAATLTVTNATLSSIAVTPTPWQVRVARGPQHTVQLTATGSFSDGLQLDITRQCSWTSSARKKASVSKTGLVTGIAAAANVTITARRPGPSKKQGTATGSVIP